MALPTSLRGLPASRSPARPPEPQVGAAVERVLEATRDLVETRAELMALELRDRARQSVRAAGLLAAGAWLLGIAWLALCAAGALALARRTSPELALAAVAAAHLLLALGFLAAAQRARP